MSNIEELRKKVLEREEPDIESFGTIDRGTQKVDDGRIFGLNGVERMFLAMGLFLVVSMFSVMLLLATASVAVP